MGRALRAASVASAAALVALAIAPTAARSAVPPRVDLRVLVVDDGGPATAAITSELDGAGTPYTTVDLAAASRPVITPGFLSDTVSGRPRAKFQAVVLPNDNPFGADSAEMAALAAYETAFGIRQVDAYTYAQPAVGLNYAQTGGYIGRLDGVQGQVTAQGAAGDFGYLKGAVPFEDNDPYQSESYGYLATPLAAQAAGAVFTPLVDAPIPGSAQRGVLVGQYAHDGRTELVIPFVYNQYQQQFRLLARGIVEWMTQGVHLGADRNYFEVQVDDVFLADDRWNSSLNCTPGDVDCPIGTGEDTDPIRMTAADAAYATQWSKAHGFTLDFVFNGGGSEDWKSDHDTSSDPLANQLVADKNSYRWVNHTYLHPFLGCVQDVSVVPWRCETTSTGATQWVSKADITAAVKDNRSWAAQHGIPLNNQELVTGEHSGLKVLPQQPADNPNLAPALTGLGVAYLASDNSREPDQRKVGPALTVPRFPMNVFYNAGTAQEETDEYNWIYTNLAQGGSGACAISGNSTCLVAPLDPATGYASYIVPLEARIDLGHVLGNNPRPHFIHQSNLAEGRIAYPVLERVLGDYAALFAANTPAENLRTADIATELQRRAAWSAAWKGGKVTAYRIGSTVTVSAPSGVAVDVTAPAGTRQAQLLGSTAFGTAYAGRLSGWAQPGLLQGAVTLTLPASAVPAAVPAATAAKAKSPATLAAPVGRLPVPRGVADAVPAGPGDSARG
ncbi:hypothetical protein [Actinacidiphila bryophytorum]|uniref:Uncharacterized protein n=1 Tax=Actinacidiphila bryophytorum TaxID=1436133 RepID=A0A9W4H745_9ACTN|nr:hypothetical protein [Actinacidiphila bryophytorum]MBM9437626.1 hypothetical protein [Actinacidiphila bryophytorum]MBN6547198.1 hypothetical protein [Actinacidiphila bryophytorum]CAG7655702.1 conserved exported hypothetical protein [Actinacidiphila bryophytorum]